MTDRADVTPARGDAGPRPARAAADLRAPAAGAAEPDPLAEKRRLLLLVRTGLSLALGYLLVFASASPAAPRPLLIAFVLGYLASNAAIAWLPLRVLGWAGFDVGLILADTIAISLALWLLPDAGADVFVFYFAIMLLASITERFALSMVAPILAGAAYMIHLVIHRGWHDVLRPAVLLYLPFFLLTGTFYGFFADRARRSRAALAAAKQRLQARSELLAMITHDLKQPLWVASQSAALLYDQLGADDASTRALAAEVMVGLKRMESLTLNFLDLSKLESRALRASPRRISLNGLVQDLVGAYRPALDLKGVTANVELSPGLPPAWIDPVQTERCLANLFDNAIKYTPRGGTVTCRTAAAGEWLAVTIGDSGPGISPDRCATLFHRFQDGADTAGRPSTGLGLYIVRALVEALGGDIALEREPRPGAWFRIRLPAAPGQSENDPTLSPVPRIAAA